MIPSQGSARDPEFTADALALATPTLDAATREPPQEQSRMPIAVAVGVLAILVGVGAYYLLWPRASAPSKPPVQPPAAAVPAPLPPPPAIEHPVERIPGYAEAAGAGGALPALDASDAMMVDVIAAILNGDAASRFLVSDNLVRHIVATIDNLPRTKVAAQVMPIAPVSGSMRVSNTSQGMAFASDNASRYAAYLRLAEKIDPARLAGFYARTYPLFQQAYVDLGYPNGYFNDRLIAVIDHLLAAPEPRQPVVLTQPRVLYEFADRELEALSAGQKILVRVGPENELRLKAKLRELRKALAAEAPPR